MDVEAGGEVRVVNVEDGADDNSKADDEDVGGGEEGELEADGHWNWFPDMSMSLIKVSMGVFPTRRTKKSCSMTADDTVRNDGNLNSSFPNLVGWLGYWVLQYSSRAHCDFSCICSIVWDSTNPQASMEKKKKKLCERCLEFQGKMTSQQQRKTGEFFPFYEWRK